MYKQYGIDKHTNGILDDIRKNLNLEDNAQVLARAITLLKLAADEAVKGGVITVGGREVEL